MIVKSKETLAAGGVPRTGSGTRIEFLDSARGLTVLLMIFINTVAPFTIIPAWTKHAADRGFTYVDAIAPTFMFIMGIGYDLSFSKRIQAGTASVLAHFFRRFGLLFLFGSIGTALIYLLDHASIEWIIFQNLAIAGVLVLPFMFQRNGKTRMLIALALLLAYGSLEYWVLEPRLAQAGSNAGFAGALVYLLAQSLGLASLVLFGSGISSRVRQGKVAESCLPWGLGLAAGGCILGYFVPPYRGLANWSYLLLGLAWGNLTVTLLYFVHKAGVKTIPVLSALGKNALLMFMVTSLLYKCLYLFVPDNAGTLSVYGGAILFEVLCIALAEVLQARKIFIKL